MSAKIGNYNFCIGYETLKFEVVKPWPDIPSSWKGISKLSCCLKCILIQTGDVLTFGTTTRKLGKITFTRHHIRAQL